MKYKYKDKLIKLYRKLSSFYNYKIAHEVYKDDIGLPRQIIIMNLMFTLNNTAVMWLCWLLFIRNNSNNVGGMFYYFVLGPLLAGLIICGVSLLVYYHVRKNIKDEYADNMIYGLALSVSYSLTYGLNYLHYRQFSLACAYLIIPILIILLHRRRRFCYLIYGWMVLFYIAANTNVIGNRRIYVYTVPRGAEILFDIWMAISIFRVLLVLRSVNTSHFREREIAIDKHKLLTEYFKDMNRSVRTPVQSIVSDCELMLRENVTKETGSEIMIIRELTGKIIEGIERVLEYSRIELSNEASLADMSRNTQMEEPSLEVTATDNVIDTGLENDSDTAPLYAPKASVLIVDDTRINLNLMRALLRRTGVKVDTAESGNEALKMMSYNMYNVILLDHMMPDMDGIETLHNISKDGVNGSTPVVVLTANAFEGAREMYLREGFSDYLAKPATATQLESMLRKYIPVNLIETPG